MKVIALLISISYASLGIAQSIGAVYERPGSSGTFTAIGEMNAARSFHTATLLANGRVLIVGGAASAELYDPNTGAFTLTGNTNTPLFVSSATLLDDGRVLIVGRVADVKCFPNIAELYDPATGAFSKTGGTVTGQIGGWAIRLHDGRVLVAGGSLDCSESFPTPIANPEAYDPSTGTFVATGPFVSSGNLYYTGGPDVSTVSLLPDGRVLIAGELNSEVYDPLTNTFSITSSMTTLCQGGSTPPQYISGRTSTPLADGKILLTGGEHEDCGRYATAELYEPSTEKFVPAGEMSRQRNNHSATLLPDGAVLIAGGENGVGFPGTTTSVESYNPSTGRFEAVGNMMFPRAGHTATLLPNGTVLLTGGYGSPEIGFWLRPMPYAEIYAPPLPRTAPLVTELQLNRASVSIGSSFVANIAGSNLSSEIFFDIRFTAPGSNLAKVSLNWQTGLTSAHTVTAGAGPGVWTITGLRPHRFESDHTGNFFPVTAKITVVP
jgi:galactose oxidase-like protein